MLIFVLQSASAAFTPTFQATIPDVLPDEAEYTRALSLSRLAYDTESLLSPVLAAALLTVITFHWMFAGTAIGFVVSALFVLSVVLPRSPAKPRVGGIYARTTRGVRIFLKTPRLTAAFTVLASIAAIGTVLSLKLWPAADLDSVPHRHNDLPAGHPHLREGHAHDPAGDHAFVLNDLHRHWPRTT